MEPPPQQVRDRRPDALGELRVLPDEVICSILDLLSPPDLARLSCVSSVMYILCNEEPLWMSKCLSTGGPLEYRDSWRKTTLYRQNLCAENNEICHKSLHFDGFNSFFLYKRWYRRHTNLSAFSFDTGDLERKKDLSLDKFHSHYDGKKPVLLTDLAKDWPAQTKWTMDQLSLTCGDTAFRISQRSSKKTVMKLKDYVSYMQVQHDEDPLYIFDEKFGESAPQLLEDYSVPHLFKEDYFDVLEHEQRPPFRWIIIGPERSGASWHVDPGLTSAWNTLLCGRKRWALYPPGRVPAGVTVHVNEEDGDINIEGPTSLQWWLDIYPQLADQDKPIECTQLPGETIYVPSGWWHCVLNLDTTIAVTQNYVNQSNFEFVCLDLAPGHRHKGVSRAGFLAISENDPEISENYANGSELNHPDLTRKEKRLKSPLEICDETGYKGFSYDIEFLSQFLDEERDHYCSIWNPNIYIGQREMREWLRKLWITRPELRELIWKGACLAINADKWYKCLMEICSAHNLPYTSENEKLPVGTGSNPVFIVSNYVIKVYAEGGFEFAIRGLGTELEFYDLLHKSSSALIEHVPEITASGFLISESNSYKTIQWDGKGIPDLIKNYFPDITEFENSKDSFLFGVWSKKQFELHGTRVTCKNVWPYLVTKRCEGDILAKLREDLSKDDFVNLASYLGVQLRVLHQLPLPPIQTEIELTPNLINYLNCEDTSILLEASRIPLEWKYVIASLHAKKRGVKRRLEQWGDPIPAILIEKSEEYLPNDVTLLLDFVQGDDGEYTASGTPVWIHSDIMDDNIFMERAPPSHCFEERAILNGKSDFSNREWIPTRIIDFSDIFIGDPLYDLIPLHLDVFRGDPYLLKKFLESYGLSFSRKSADRDKFLSSSSEESKCKRISYRAMCYCILHEENVLGAIFSLSKDLRNATSWETVEETIWGELNNY